MCLCSPICFQSKRRSLGLGVGRFGSLGEVGIPLCSVGLAWFWILGVSPPLPLTKEPLSTQ